MRRVNRFHVIIMPHQLCDLPMTGVWKTAVVTVESGYLWLLIRTIWLPNRSDPKLTVTTTATCPVGGSVLPCSARWTAW